MTDIVERQLRRWAASEFDWGKTDCSMVLADYVLEATGRDGASHLRGRYDDLIACVHLTDFLRRGLETVVAGCAERAGLVRTIAPCRGDIGVLELTRGRKLGGLCLGDRWAVKSTDGVLFIDHPVVAAAWAVFESRRA